MELTKTRKTVDMEEIDIISEFAVAANKDRGIGWNKVYDKINQSREPENRLCNGSFVEIMKHGGATDGRIYGWSKKKYLKSIGYKEQSLTIPENPEISENVSEQHPPAEPETTDVESSPEAIESSKLSDDALKLLKALMEVRCDGKPLKCAQVCKRIGYNKNIATKLLGELFNMQIVTTTKGHLGRGARYILTMDNETLFGLYPELKIENVVDNTTTQKISVQNIVEKPSQKEEEWSPNMRLQDSVMFIRQQCDKGIRYRDEDSLTDIEPVWKRRMAIHKMLVEIGILERINSECYMFHDPEDTHTSEWKPRVRKTVVDKQNTNLNPKEDLLDGLFNSQQLTGDKDAMKHITVNNNRSDVQYRITWNKDNIVIDIL